MNKKILIVSKSNSYGGAEKNAFWLFNRFVRDGYDCFFLCLDFRGSLENTKNIYCSQKNFRNSIVFFLKILYFTRPDSVIVFSEYIYPLFALTKKIFGFRLIFRSINTPQNDNSLLKRFIIKLIPSSDLIIFQSVCMANNFYSKIKINESKHVVIYNPLKINISPTINKTITKQLRIISIGRIEVQKDYLETLNVLNNLNQLKVDFHLDIFGIGSQENLLKFKIKELNLSHLVTLNGYDEDVIYKIQNYDVLLLTSKYEGFPNVLIESISQGIPVVSYDINCGPSEIIIDYVNGFLIQPNNTSEMAKFLKNIKSRVWNKTEMLDSLNRFNEHKIYNEYKNII